MYIGHLLIKIYLIIDVIIAQFNFSKNKMKIERKKMSSCYPLMARCKIFNLKPVVAVDFHDKVYFEIWNIIVKKRGLKLLVKCYDYEIKKPFLQWVKVYSFCRMIYGKSVVAPDCIYIRMEPKKWEKLGFLKFYY